MHNELSPGQKIHQHPQVGLLIIQRQGKPGIWFGATTCRIIGETSVVKQSIGGSFVPTTLIHALTMALHETWYQMQSLLIDV